MYLGPPSSLRWKPALLALYFTHTAHTSIRGPRSRIGHEGREEITSLKRGKGPTMLKRSNTRRVFMMIDIQVVPCTDHPGIVGETVV